jgi:hypothetical protein
MFCDWFSKLVSEPEVLTVLGIIWSIIVKFTGEWEEWKKTFLRAGIGFAIPVLGYFLGIATKCWTFGENFLPYLLVAFTVAAGVLAPTAVKSARIARIEAKSK